MEMNVQDYITDSSGERLFPCYGASEMWYSLFIEAIARGNDDRNAMSYAFNAAPCRKKSLARCVAGEPPSAITLSIPVEGSSKTIKGLPPYEWRISRHGEWNLKHIRAFESVYGRTPFFSHIFPDLREILLNPPDMVSDLCFAVHSIITDALGLRHTAGALKELIYGLRDCPFARTVAEAPAPRQDAGVLGLLFKKGPDAIFTLASPLIRH